MRARPGRTCPLQAPSRVMLQQLHDAGMVDALPDDVQVSACARVHACVCVPVCLNRRHSGKCACLVVCALQRAWSRSQPCPANCIGAWSLYSPS